MNGAKIAVKCLAEQGVTQVFAYPGASVLPLLSAIDAEKRISVCMNTHEQFCAFAADGYARASGRVGVCIARAVRARQTLSPVSRTHIWIPYRLSR